jgi:hypothetical protein
MRERAFAVRFKKHIAATDLGYHIEVSNDLITWKAAQTDDVEPVTLSAADVSAGVTCVRERAPVADGNHLYMRVRVSLNQ